ncbi:hypothetical protein PGTUg99_025167 [Puccinia graminis f. sp. tritici]|uniref:Reverse transcriptase Ty1/copia-type domain-containing protein n=1 Tax=Puccinia graminis f. sp. tritici TaxID=56615 RepID=A0A5B0QSP8_PUCGR|nr:hypothetical protein PGTUg99_025167 [Puccinia graminis f. sp. tritici]
MAGENAEGWTKAIKDEPDNIEDYEVWLDQMTHAEKLLDSTWGFKSSPSLSPPQRNKKRNYVSKVFCKHMLPIKQFNVKSTFLFAPLEEEIYIRNPEGSARTAPYLELVKSLYGLKQARKNCYHPLTQKSRLQAQDCQNKPPRAETATKRCRSQTDSKTTQNPSDETNSHSPWGRSHSKPATKDKTKNNGDEKRRTATPSIAHRISQSTGPELLARINQEHHEPQSEQEANASQP